MFVDVFDAFIFGDGAVDGFVAVDGRTVEDGLLDELRAVLCRVALEAAAQTPA